MSNKKIPVNDYREAFSSDEIFVTDRLDEELQEHFSESKIPPRELGLEWAPLSFAQQRLWFMQQLQPGNPFYNVFQSFYFSFSVDADVFSRALREIVRRHQILRTRFLVRDDQPMQYISADGEIPLIEHDLRSWSEAEQRPELLRISAAQASMPFELSGHSLARAALVHFDAQETAVLLTFHHIIVDAWSMQVFCNELKLLYEAYSLGATSPLPDLPVQYADYAIWQQRQWSNGAMLTDLDFWRSQLAELTQMQLPIQKARPETPSFRGRMLSFDVPQPVYARLKKLSEKHDCTLFVTLLTVFKVLLFRYTGQTDIVVGCPFSGRTHTDMEKMIGFFVNTLVLRSKLSAFQRFDETIELVKRSSVDAFTHAALPFEKLVGELQPERDITSNPLFQVIFQLLSSKDNFASTASTRRHNDSHQSQQSKFDLTLTMSEELGVLRGHLEYNTGLFANQSIERLIRHFLHLLHGVVSKPSSPLSQFDLIDAEEKQQLLVGFNQSRREYEWRGFVHELISEQAQLHPGAVALVSDDEQRSYGWLESLSNQLANELICRGVGPEQLVAVAQPRSATMVALHLAILKAGAAFVPLDTAYPFERLQFILNDLNAALLITEEGLTTQLPSNQTPILLLDHLMDEAAQRPATPPHVSLIRQNRCYVMYTSGSTGKPKGVELHHGGLLNLVQWNREAYCITDSDRSLQMATPAYDAYIYEVFPALAAGASVFLVDEPARHAAEELRRRIVDRQVTYAFISTAMGELVMEDAWPDHISLRILATGGEKLTRLPTTQPAFQHLNFYGPTENSVMSTFCPISLTETGPPPIGKAIANVQLYALDEFLNPVPAGITGELYLGGAGVGRGYLNRPRLTAERFVPDPFSQIPASRLYRTGDLVRWRTDANLEFVGRTDHQVKLRGFRIELEEIERVLCVHPGVREAAVVLQATTDGTGNSLTAFVSAEPEALKADQQLKDWIRNRLPAFMVPAQVVLLRELPKSFNGKTDRNALQKQTVQSESSQGHNSGARTPLEKSIAEVWANFLHNDQITVERNFFDMGGHSLMMAQVHHKLRQLLQRDVPLVDLFQYPTIRSLSAHLMKKPEHIEVKKATEERASKQRNAFASQRWNKR